MIFQSQQKTRLCLFRASSGRGKIFFFYHTPLFFGDFPILFFLFLSPENRRCLRCKLRACRIINIRNIAFIGLAEVENANALKDLTAQPPLKARNMQFCHIEGPDKRGIDCALLYNPALFTVKNVKLVPYVQELAKDSAFKTRGFLTVRGEMAGEDVAVIVCHWPSRFSGSFYRESGARQTKVVKDSLLRVNPDMKVFVMGDMNDDPTDKSMHEVLRAKPEIQQVGEGDMYNPWYNILAKEGKGTLFYNGSWNLFDQIVMTPNLLNKDAKKKDYSSLKFWKNHVFRRDYLIQQEGQYKGSPLRTKAGGRWLNGYSDHLPVVLYLVKEKK